MSHQIEIVELEDYTREDTLASSNSDGKRLKLRVYVDGTPNVFTVIYTTTNLLDNYVRTTKNFNTLAEAVEFYNAH